MRLVLERHKLARLQASYGTVLRAGPLTGASLRLLSEEIAQLDALMASARLTWPA
jgi:hypothetical protein